MSATDGMSELLLSLREQGISEKVDKAARFLSIGCFGLRFIRQYGRGR